MSAGPKMRWKIFADIYRIMQKNKGSEIKWLRFYVLAALGYLLLGLVTTFTSFSDRFLALVCNHVWVVTYVTVFNLILFEYALPYVFYKRKTVIYNVLSAVLLALVYLALYSYGSYAWRLFGTVLHLYTPRKVYSSMNAALQNQLFYCGASVIIFGIVRHIYAYIKLNQSAQQLRIEKQEAELNYLRSQTNPHFLFNTLNNIYSLAKDKNDLAPESILRLSKMLRYMLYETNGEYVAIEEEVKIIGDYIELEKLRYDDSLLVDFKFNVEDMKQPFPPLLLIPLVENAFKHGVSETRNNPFVDIHLSVINRQLAFFVKNSIDNIPGQLPVRENIGLPNLRRQLELLYKNHDLSIEQSESFFAVKLKINLESHV